MGMTIRVGFYTSPDKVKHSTCTGYMYTMSTLRVIECPGVPHHPVPINIYCMYTTEPKFVNVLRSPVIDSQPGEPVRQPYI
jgi:hypothetical protein